MRDSRFRLIIIIITVVVFTLAIGTESRFFSDFEYSFRTRMFNKIVADRERVLDNSLEAMKPIIAGKNHHGSVTENNLFTIADQNNITILEYLDNKLVYWSDNEYSVPEVLTDSLFAGRLIFLQNGWFLAKTISNGNETIVGLLRIRTDFGFENDIIKSGFGDEYRVPENVGFSLNEAASEYHVFDKNGEFIFSLIFPDAENNKYLIAISLVLWCSFLLLLVILILSIADMLVADGKVRLAVGIGVFVLFLFYLIFLLTGAPSILSGTDLFSPYMVSFNSFIPTLGHLTILSIFGSISAFLFFRYYPLPVRQIPAGIARYFIITGLLSLIVLLLVFVTTIFSDLILGSGINFEAYRVLKISLMSIIAYSAILLLMTVPVLLIIKLFHYLKNITSAGLIFPLLTTLLIPVAFLISDIDSLITFLILYLLLTSILFYSVRKRSGFFNVTVIISLVFGLYSLYIITVRSNEKAAENIKIEAISFSTENDPAAEHLLLDIWPLITADTVLTEMMNVEYFDRNLFDKVSDYLQQKYFTGYWRNYNFNVFLCRDDESLRIGPGDNVFENCFSFFERRIKKDGSRLTGTDFYFLDNQGGRSYYIGKLRFKSPGRNLNGLYIELYSDINVFQEGYSELLLDKKFHGYSGLREYAFAKYLNGEVVIRNGDFPYNMNDADYVVENSDFRFFNSGGFKHILYKNGNATVIISRPRLTVSDVVISFAYLFAFILLFINILLLIGRKPDIRTILNFSFRQKLQISFVGILLFSFMLIGIVIVTITINQYKVRHSENLKDRMNSIYLELEGKIGGEKYLTPAWSAPNYPTINDLLIKFSNIFLTDINLYNPEGFLIGTSRPEIFTRDMTSLRINNLALINLTSLTKTEYYHNEKIGNLEYISAYTPFYNTDNKVIAYLNLPYFRMQNVLRSEISNVMVAVVNFALLFIVITMALAVIISGRLTAPLTMLGEGLASVVVGKKSEHLSYDGKDEIGELVKQYNRMVDEIEDSANKLANSEREYAWREMAKQIAHEIKNPLTPMKLNVQQLHKSWKDKAPGFDTRIENFTNNQIEYIDNLSTIATAFSSFAKMPGSNPAEVNLIDQLNTTLQLFKDTDNVVFDVKWPHESKIIVQADKEHLNGVFSNLFKNGIQSVPADREGLITVDLEVRGNRVVVAISDNGTGIPEELHNKMFTPNFTTKSSGMGLGLSIVRKYLESAGGTIWFESVSGAGTTFFVELPLKYTVEKPG